MKKRVDLSVWVKRVLLIAIVLFLGEALLFAPDMFVSLLLFLAITYFGWKRSQRLFGKFCMWGGGLLFLIIAFQTLAFRFLVLVLLIFIIVQMAERRSPTKTVKLNLLAMSGRITRFEKRPWLRTYDRSKEDIDDRPYAWEDVWVQTFYGETVIDLSKTVLPEGDSTIVVQHVFGDITVLLPYDWPCTLHHQALSGRTVIFQEVDEQLWNASLSYETENFAEERRRIKLFTSVVFGNVEVKRV